MKTGRKNITKFFGISIAATLMATALCGCSEQKVNVVELKSENLSSTVKADGYIQSSEEKNIYTSLNYTIKEVNVEVGDVVRAGDVLCTLDTKMLETAIISAKTALNSGMTNSDHNITQAEKDYMKMATEIENGTYQPIVLAERNVEYAEDALEIAKKNYNNKLEDIEKNNDSALKTMKTNLTNIASQIKIKDEILDNAFYYAPYGDFYRKEYKDFLLARRRYNADRNDATRKEYDDAIIDMNTMAMGNKDINSAWQAIYADYVTEDNLLIEYENLLSMTDDSVDALKDALDNAQLTYDSAVTDLEITIRDSEKALEDMKDALDNSKAVTDFSAEQKQLADLEKDLADCTITAEIDGTVTAVYAKEGNISGGVMFVIEDTENLEVLAKFKEYDIAGIEVGMPATVKADATGSTEYEGIVTRIAPTAIKNNTSTDTEFEVEIAVSGKDTKLLIGMQAEAEVTLAEKAGAFSVPYSSVRYEDDKAFVLVAENTGDGYTTKKVFVSTGIDGDTEIEIYGTEIKDGLYIITDSDESITDGLSVKPVL